MSRPIRARRVGDLAGVTIHRPPPRPARPTLAALQAAVPPGRRLTRSMARTLALPPPPPVPPPPRRLVPISYRRRVIPPPPPAPPVTPAPSVPRVPLTYRRVIRRPAGTEAGDEEGEEGSLVDRRRQRRVAREQGQPIETRAAPPPPGPQSGMPDTTPGDADEGETGNAPDDTERAPPAPRIPPATRSLVLLQMEGRPVMGPFTPDQASAAKGRIMGTIQAARPSDLQIIHPWAQRTRFDTNYRTTLTNEPWSNTHTIRDGTTTNNWLCAYEEYDSSALTGETLAELNRRLIRRRDDLNNQRRRTWFSPSVNLYDDRLFVQSAATGASEVSGYQQVSLMQPFGPTSNVRRVLQGWGGPDRRPASNEEMGRHISQLHTEWVQRHPGGGTFQVVFRYVARPALEAGVTIQSGDLHYRTFNYLPDTDTRTWTEIVQDAADAARRDQVFNLGVPGSDPEHPEDVLVLDTSSFAIQYRVRRFEGPTRLRGGGNITGSRHGVIVCRSRFYKAFSHPTNPRKNDCFIRNLVAEMRARELHSLIPPRLYETYRRDLLSMDTNDYCLLTDDHILPLELALGVKVNVLLDEVNVTRVPEVRDDDKAVYKATGVTPVYYYESGRPEGRPEFNFLLKDEHYWVIESPKRLLYSPVAAIAYPEGSKTPTFRDELNYISSFQPSSVETGQAFKRRVIADHEFLRSKLEEADIDPDGDEPMGIITEKVLDKNVVVDPPLNRCRNYRKELKKQMRAALGIRSGVALEDYRPPGEFLRKMKYCSIVFDYEAVYDEHYAYKPYSLAWVILEHDVNTGLPIFDYENPPTPYWNERCKMDTGPGCTYPLLNHLMTPDATPCILVGYNNSRYDNLILIEEMLAQDAYPSPFWAQNALMGLRFNGHMTFDAFNFTRCSLDFACKSFKTNPTKMAGFDHSVPQKIFNRDGWDGLTKWTTDNHNYLTEYNKRDVLSLADLYCKLCRMCYECCGPNRRLYDHMTIGSLAFDVWESMNERAQDKTEICSIIPNPFAVDKTMRKAITGGRCQVFTPGGMPLDEEGRYYMVDVKSLYPFVMKNFTYPNGDCIETDHELPGKHGAYRCTIVTQPMKRVIPKKEKGRQLDWHVIPEDGEDGESFERWITTPDIECIRENGGHVIVHEGYAYDKASYLFKDYVHRYEELKNEQDRLKAEDSADYNPSARELYKLLLNNLSGKVIQRTFIEKTKLCLSEFDLHASCEKLKPDTIHMGMYKKAVMVAGTLIKPPKYAKKPAILGMFIYAYARKYMYDILIKDYDVLYMDTDSALLREDEYLRLRNEKPHLFADLDQGGRPIKFGDLEEEVCDANGNPANHIILLRPKAYMVYNESDPSKNKMKLKGISKRDRYIPNESSLALVRKLMRDKNIIMLDQLYDNGFLNRMEVEDDEEDRLRKATDVETFCKLSTEREGWFLCSQFKRQRAFQDMDYLTPVQFAVRRVMMLKKLTFSEDGSVEHLIVEELADILCGLDNENEEEDEYGIDRLIEAMEDPCSDNEGSEDEE